MENLTGSAEINGHIVRIGPDGRECDCKDFMYRRKDRGENCKHLDELERRLKKPGDVAAHTFAWCKDCNCLPRCYPNGKGPNLLEPACGDGPM